MTRETKIGLLIGLGFIGVFAVLLSHTGTPVPTGDGMASAPKTAPGTSPAGAHQLSNSTYVSPEQSRMSRAIGLATPATRPSTGRVGLGEAPSTPRNPRGSEDAASPDGRLALLPEPKSLMRSPSFDIAASPDRPALPVDKILTGAKSVEGGAGLASTSVPPSNLPTQRVAPQQQELVTVVQPPRVEPPQPGARPDSPTVTANPEAGPVEVATGESPTSPPVRQEAPKEYVVQKGDTLRKIIKDSYGVSSTKVVEFLVASNKSRIKDKDTIMEGQKLVLPPLPPEMFEVAPNFDVRGLGEGVRTVSNEELSRSLGLQADRERVAPVPVRQELATLSAPATPPAIARTSNPAGKTEKSSSTGYRLIEIRANETLRSIAGRELGSINDWNEIQKLNPNLDPKKLKPGTKIKVPARKPMTSSGGGRRESA
ncbi:MAG TPA: LysM peptidoglycan-binding domain-containing protein [Phycisphaerae bacterium]|nr:LysM peptidoglycan-binding domain-containing protein [Phycisphaerae bacterium]